MIFQSINFYLKLIVAFIPAAIMGLIFSDAIDDLMESPAVVAISLLLGGILLLFVDKWFKQPRIESDEEMTYWTALKVGFFQCLAMIPGVSRSGATIIGGMGTLLGPLVGGLLYVVAQAEFNTSGNLHLYTGIALILVLMFLPGGITGGIASLWNKVRGKITKGKGE